jgi:hypothetical protein
MEKVKPIMSNFMWSIQWGIFIHIDTDMTGTYSGRFEKTKDKLFCFAISV